MDSLAETEPARTNPKIINTTLCISLLQFFCWWCFFFVFPGEAHRKPGIQGAYRKSCSQP